MRLPWKRRVRPVDPGREISSRAVELQTAKEILAEVFGARPADVEEMIKRRLEERNRAVQCEEGLWPATFCLGE